MVNRPEAARSRAATKPGCKPWWTAPGKQASTWYSPWGGTNPVNHPVDPGCSETQEQIKANFREFNYGFWEKYAPLYGGETHVIFEIQNEPYFHIEPGSPSVGLAQPTPDWVIDLNARAYQLMATHAPETPVLVFSYAFLHDAQAVRDDLARFETAVADLPPLFRPDRWSMSEMSSPSVNPNLVGVAFHGYFVDWAQQNTPTDTVAALVAGPPIHLIETESWSLQFQGMNISNIGAYEHYNISWLSFNEPFAPNYHSWDGMFRNLIDQPPDGGEGLIWVPDDGTWPAVSDVPVGATVSLEFGLRGFVRVDVANGYLIADADGVSNATKMTLIQGSDGGVLLQSMANGNYVTLADGCPDPNCQTAILQATATQPSEAETFIWVTRESDGRVALRALSNQNYVTADLNYEDPPILRANRWRGGGSWSGFRVVIDEPPGPAPGIVPNFEGSIGGANIDGLTVETSSPLIDFTWDHASAGEELDYYEIIIQPPGGPWLFREIKAYPGQTHRIQTSGLEDGTSYSIHIRAWDVLGRPGPFGPSGGVFTVNLPVGTQIPFLGQPYGITPNEFTVIQAEDFDEGGEGVAFHDTTPGNTPGYYRDGAGQDVDIVLTDNRYHLGFIDPGEWTEYALEITPGVYDIEIWTATTLQGRRFYLELYDEFDGLLASTQNGPSVAPLTADWGHFQKVVIPNINLSGNLSGSRFLRLAHLDGLINVDRMTLRPTVETITSDAFAGHQPGAILNGTQTDDGTKIWRSSGDAVFAAPGFITSASTTGPNGFLPFRLSETGGKAVLLEADLNLNTSNSNDWLSLGFHTIPGGVWGGNGEIWLLVRRDGRYTVLAETTTYNLANGQLNLSPLEVAAPKRAVLKYHPGNRKVSAWINGKLILDEQPLPAGFSPVINHAGFTAHGGGIGPQQIFVDNVDINLQ